ncbi:MAG: DUF58 domain-containing protein [Planctomycetes bacterium]|nr:DUF58 domain-containing protein [Planctomycetota bacterium]MCB9909798.1 DUF58 domain-containing protein [Planctomycetota bacterium]MCB9912293.1 DUF58 domain-containing protein [Planctomycetota bacterium]HPF12732.1 DUF58 domain-containing protein [Planctomycetota bacterium]
MKLTLFGARALFFYGVMIVAFFGAPYANLFFLLLGFLSVQWVMAWIWTWRNGVGVEARFGALEPIVAGSCASLAATLTCPRGTRFDLQLNLDLDAERTIAGRLPVLRGTGTVQLHTPALARGVYALRDARLSSTYPFGLLRRRIPVASPDELVVYPAPLDGVAASRSAQDLLAEWMGTGPTGQGDLQPSGLRDHRASDGLRGIHWRASARRGKLVLQEWDGGATQGMEVVLDRRCESEELENSLRELSTLIQLARDSKQALAIRTQGCNETFGEGHGDWGGALRLLAAAEVLPMDGPAPPSAAPEVVRLPRRLARA